MDGFAPDRDGSPIDTALLREADRCRRHAFAPFSRFSVGAAIRLRSGAVYAGCNVVNASFPVGVCAERNAIAAAVAAEGPEIEITEMVLVADDDGAVADCTPCGACRQALVQFGRGARVFHRNDGAFRCDTAEALLPFSFRFSPKPR